MKVRIGLRRGRSEPLAAYVQKRDEDQRPTHEDGGP
jgi:hypothetical protein